MSPKNQKLILSSIIAVAIAAGGYYLYRRQSLPDNSIAVQPFSDLSPNHDQDYFGDGIADEIINVLSQAQELKVIARSSSFQLRGRNLKEAGEKLGVTHILEGTVSRSGDQLKITARLIQVSDASLLWSKNFEGQASDLIQTENEIAVAVASAFNADLATSDTQRETWNEEAYKDYQIGRFFFDKNVGDDNKKAAAYFESSIQKDSAHSIVWSYLEVSSSKWGDPQAVIRINDAALQLDSLNGDAWANKASMAMHFNSHAKALQYLKKALTCPTNPRVLRIACNILNSIGNPEQAIPYGKRAVQLDPIQPKAYEYLADCYLSLNEYDSSLWISRKALTVNPFSGRGNVIVSLVMLKRWKEAEEEISKITDEGGRLFWSCAIYIAQGNMEAADRELDEYKKWAEGKWDVYYGLTELYALKDEKEPAISTIQKAFKGRDLPVWVKTDPWLNPLRKDPRFIP